MEDRKQKRGVISLGPLSIILPLIFLVLSFFYCEGKPPSPCGKVSADADRARLLGLADGKDDACAIQRWNASTDAIRKSGMVGGEGTSEPSARPAGDLCGMRHPKLYSGYPKSLYRQFAVVSFSNDPDFKLSELLRLEQEFADTPQLAFRAAIGRASVALRAGRIDHAVNALGAAEQLLTKIPSECQADYQFLSGVLAERQGRPLEALQHYSDAVSADEYYWNARTHLLTLLYSDLSSRMGSVAGCLDTTRLFLTHLLKLQSMGQTRTQYIDFAEQLITHGGDDLPAADLVLAFIYAWNDALKEAKRYQQRVLDAPHKLPSACQNLIIQQAILLLKPNEKMREG